MDGLLKIGDKVRVGDKIGEIIRLENRGSSTILKVAFEEGPAKDFVYPPTKIEKILSPIELIHNKKFDPPIIFDLHYEATRLSLAYAYDHLLSLSFIRTNLARLIHKFIYNWRMQYSRSFSARLNRASEVNSFFERI